MATDYTPAILGLVGLVVLLTSMVGFVLTRPSDLSSTPR
jgi:hypothetical protein